jgi:hypothetical protein
VGKVGLLCQESLGLFKPKVLTILCKAQLWQNQKAQGHLKKYETIKRSICHQLWVPIQVLPPPPSSTWNSSEAKNKNVSELSTPAATLGFDLGALFLLRQWVNQILDEHREQSMLSLWSSFHLGAVPTWGCIVCLWDQATLQPQWLLSGLAQALHRKHLGLGRIQAKLSFQHLSYWSCLRDKKIEI